MRMLSTEQLTDMMDRNEDFYLIDVLTQDSFRENHITGAINIPLAALNFAKMVEDRVGSKDRKVVVYCSGIDGPISAIAVRLLEEAGFTNVLHYWSGLQGWKDAGYSLECSFVPMR